jgi:hypothetical protein
LLRDVVGRGEEITGDVLDAGPRLLRQEVHHLRRWRATADGPDLGPSIAVVVEQRAHGVEAGDAIRAGDDGGFVLDGGVERGEAVENSAVAGGAALRSHLVRFALGTKRVGREREMEWLDGRTGDFAAVVSLFFRL